MSEQHPEPDENRESPMEDDDLDVPEEQADAVKGGLTDIKITKPIDKSSP